MALAFLALGAGFAWLVGSRFAAMGVTMPPLAFGLITGVVGALLGRRAGLDPWWMAIQVAFPLGILAAQGAPVPSWVWLSLFLVLVVVYWNEFQ
jgi:hypothetical protein